MIMNRIKFNEGGQPVFLDDFKLLQDNQQCFVDNLIHILSGDTNVIISGAEVDYQDIEGRDDALKVIVGEGKAFIGGDIVEWTSPLEIEYVYDVDDDIYLVVSEQDEDLRDFNDGNQRYCRTTKKVSLSKSKEGLEAINIFAQTSFPEALKKVLGMGVSSGLQWYNVSIPSEYIANGFSVGLSYCIPAHGQLRIKLILQSNDATWSNNVGEVFYWGDVDTNLSAQLRGKYSQAVFVSDRGQLYNYIIEWCREDYTLVLHGCGEDAPHPEGKIDDTFIIYL